MLADTYDARGGMVSGAVGWACGTAWRHCTNCSMGAMLGFFWLIYYLTSGGSRVSAASCAGRYEKPKGYLAYKKEPINNNSGSQTSSLDTGKEYQSTRITHYSSQKIHPNFVSTSWRHPWDPIPMVTLKRMSVMANTTPLVTTVTKPTTNPRDVDATPRVNTQDFYEEYYEDILPVIMDKVRRDKRKEVHARLDFGKSSRERRTREDSYYSSARARTTNPERLTVRDRLRYGDRHVLDRLGHRRQSAFDRLSDTYSPSTTKSRPCGTDSRDHPWGRSRPHRLDTSNEDCPKDRERFRGVGESYDDSFSHSYRGGNCSRHMKRRKDNESPLSSVSKSNSSDRRYQKSRSKRHKSTDEDNLTMPWMCEEEDPFTPRICNFKSSRRTRMPNNVKTYDGTGTQRIMSKFSRRQHRWNGEAAAASKKKGHTSWKAHDQSKRQTSEKRTPKEILAAEAGKFQPPPPMVTPVEKRSSNKFCDFHNDKGHSTDECMQLKKHIEELVRAGKLSHLIKEIKHGRDQSKTGKKETRAKDKPTAIYMIKSWQRMTRQKVAQSFERVKEITFPPLTANSEVEGPLVIEAEMDGHMIHRMYVDGGSSMEILYEHCFNWLWREIKNQRSMAEIQAVPSTAYGMLKFTVEGGIVTIRSTILIPAECTSVNTSSVVSKEEGIRPENFKVALHLDFVDQEVAIEGTLSAKGRTKLCLIPKKNSDIFAWQPPDMTGVPRSVAEHRLNIREGYSPVRQKKRGQVPERAKAIQAERLTGKLNLYGATLSSVSWMLTKATTRYSWQMRMNAGATYQRLVDKAFDSQIGRNIEVYVDDLVVKSYTEAEMLRDIDETFRTLRKINMKLPKKWPGTKLYSNGKASSVTSLRSQETSKSVMLGEHNIMYRLRTPVKGQILADFLTEMPDKNPPATPVAETQQEPWTLFTDGLSCMDGSGAGLILTNPEGIEFTYTLRFQFADSNNEAEYKALIAGLRIAAQMGVQNVHVNVDSKLVANQVLETYVAKEENMIKYLDKVKSLVNGFTNFSISQVLVEILKEKSIKENEVTTVVEEDGPRWMTPIVEYLKEGTLPSDRTLQAIVPYVVVKMCWIAPGRIHRPVTRNPQQPLTPITAPWPFYKLGIDIAGPFPKGPGKVKFLIVAMDYFTKWIEAKAVATITGGQNWNAYVPHRSSGSKAKLKMKKYYNARVRGVTFRPGDFVYRSNDASHAVAGGKLGQKWEGPYEVTEALGDGAYKL
nr:reverse transcriptase domain-containing protein [Tanacetum cinerariifolium]